MPARQLKLTYGCLCCRRLVEPIVVLHADGRTRVVEIGDGQVSDWPEGVDDSELLRALGGLQ
jgi:ATP-grasp domain, R2K clade family 3